MIKISTRELVGMLKDVLPFAATDTDTLDNVVRLEWDGESLIASATDRFRMARETWTPDDEEYTEAADADVCIYEADAPLFSVRLSLPDVKSIIKAFTMQAKLNHAVVRISVGVASLEENTYAVRFAREGSDRWSRLEFHATGYGAPREGEIPEPDIAELLATFEGRSEPTTGVAWNAGKLDAFAKVRPLGPLKMTFTGYMKPVHFAMGSRFQGLIQPVREEVPADEYARAA